MQFTSQVEHVGEAKGRFESLFSGGNSIGSIKALIHETHVHRAASHLE